MNFPSPNDYVRMFANKSFAYLFSDIFLGYYKAHGVLSTARGDQWMSFLPKISKEQMLHDGAELYTTSEKYRAYADEFATYRDSSAQEFARLLGIDPLTPEIVQKFFALASKHFSYYSKTEFFYTDGIEQVRMYPSIQEFDALKLEGRAYLNKILFEDEGYIRSLIKKLCAQLSIPEQDLLTYGMAEILTTMQTSVPVSANALAERSVFFAMPDQTLFGKDAEEPTRAFHAPYLERASVMHGKTAHKGKVTARARVLVPDFNDFNKIAVAVAAMQEGEVLVAETTAPEIILACKKASAIITNQGGMLSHAAIIARELKIPCIIGTDKDVILNITTGDLVEVDADVGRIVVLERVNPER